jgi:hypothetical protein
MPESRTRKPKHKSRARKYRDSYFLTSPDQPEPRIRREAQSWPVVGAYVPIRDVWRATGYGTAGVIREQPNGRQASAFFILNLSEDGLTMMFGKDDETPKETDSMVKSMGSELPPMEAGPIELVSEYVWGAYVLGETKGALWPPNMTEQYLGLVSKPPGTRHQWLNRFIGPDGLTPPGLLKVIRQNRPLDDHEIPESQEVAIFTTISFEVDMAAAIFEQLRKRDPDFAYTGRDGEVEFFDWTRQYPKGHWSPLASLGGRQILGSIRVEPERLIAEVKTLSMGARLAGILKGIFGEHIRLKDTTWKGVADLLAERSGEA